MQKMLLKCIGVVLCSIVFVGIVGIFSLSAGETKDAVQQHTQELTPKYTFSVYGDRLALYERGFVMPVEIFDIYLEALPPEEQQKIKIGIHAENDTEIQKIIEDYTS